MNGTKLFAKLLILAVMSLGSLLGQTSAFKTSGSISVWASIRQWRVLEEIWLGKYIPHNDCLIVWINDTHPDSEVNQYRVVIRFRREGRQYEYTEIVDRVEGLAIVVVTVPDANISDLQIKIASRKVEALGEEVF